MIRILVIDDDDAFREGLVEAVADLGYAVRQADSGEAALALLRETARPEVDAILLDHRLPGIDGIEVLRRLREDAVLSTIPVAMLTAYADSDNTIAAMRLGAFDHLTKPIRRADLATLLAGLCAAASQPAGDGEDTDDPPADPAGAAPAAMPRMQTTFLGASQALREVQKRIGRASASDATVLVSGETGTGKEVVARLLHSASARKHGPFVAVNCAAVPAELLESELFGHEKGAFTGAIQARRGSFRAADGGVLFLDEIGDMPQAMQAKLLRVLQERSVTPLGGRGPVAIDVRIVAATHRALATLVAEGGFREDLYYRLNVIPIHLAPLRERIADILPLAEHFLDESAQGRSRAPREFTRAAQRLLLDFKWPGNVRELRNAVERASVLAQGAAVADTDLAFLREGDGEVATGAAELAHWRDLSLPEAVARLERMLIVDALAQAQGNRAEVARRLGIHRQLLYKKLQHYGLG